MDHSPNTHIGKHNYELSHSEKLKSRCPKSEIPKVLESSQKIPRWTARTRTWGIHILSGIWLSTTHTF